MVEYVYYVLNCGNAGYEDWLYDGGELKVMNKSKLLAALIFSYETTLTLIYEQGHYMLYFPGITIHDSNQIKYMNLLKRKKYVNY